MNPPIDHQISDDTKKLISNYGIDQLLEGRHEMYRYKYLLLEPHILKKYSLNMPEIRPATPLAFKKLLILLPIYGHENNRVSIKKHLLSPDKKLLTLFLERTFEDDTEKFYFFAVCRKVKDQNLNLYVAGIYHQLYGGKNFELFIEQHG